MREIRLNLENCFGIKKLSETINYSNNNAAIIYAPNGTMKSSLAKTFEAIRDNTRIEEKIYGLRSSCSITDENNVEISKEQVIVINPFNENAYENQGLLMANETLRKKYLGIYNSIESKKMSLYSKIKEKFGYSTRQNFDVRNTMLNDWGLMPKEEYACLNIIKESLHDSTMTCLLEEDDLDYALW